jgi:hypothetical protein
MLIRRGRMIGSEKFSRHLGSAGPMNHLDINILIATNTLLCPPPPHQPAWLWRESDPTQIPKKLVTTLSSGKGKKEGGSGSGLGADELTRSNVSTALEFPAVASLSIAPCSFVGTCLTAASTRPTQSSCRRWRWRTHRPAEGQCH